MFSIIVPVYNAEKYIRRCVDSILRQSYKDFELILVDDCSSDKSLEICRSFLSGDSRVKIVHLDKNGGVVNARREGIRNSSHEYIVWVDADDWIDCDLLEKIYVPIKDFKVDVVMYGYTSVVGRQTAHVDDSIPSGLYSDEKMIWLKSNMLCFDKHKQNRYITPSLWVKCIRKNLLISNVNNVPETVRLGEDSAMSYSSILQADSLYKLDGVYGYYYFRNPHSVTMHYIGDYIANAVWIYKYVSKVSDGIIDINTAINTNILFVSAFSIYNEMLSNENKENIINYYRTLCSSEFVREANKDADISNLNWLYRTTIKLMVRGKVNTLYCMACPYRLIFKIQKFFMR